MFIFKKLINGHPLNKNLQHNLFKTRLAELINMGHPIVKLANDLSWDKMEFEFQKLHSEQGRPFFSIRKIARMLMLKQIFKESDESVVPLLRFEKASYKNDGNFKATIQVSNFVSEILSPEIQYKVTTRSGLIVFSGV